MPDTIDLPWPWHDMKNEKKKKRERMSSTIILLLVCVLLYFLFVFLLFKFYVRCSLSKLEVFFFMCIEIHQFFFYTIFVTVERSRFITPFAEVWRLAHIQETLLFILYFLPYGSFIFFIADCALQWRSMI